MVLFWKVLFKRRTAAFLLSVLFLYVCYNTFSTEKKAALIITQINIGKEASTRKALRKINKVQNIQVVQQDIFQTGSFSTVTSDIKRFNAMTFNIELVTNSFQECHKEELDIPAYLKGYTELYNFFNVLGSVFGFIASDVKEKIDILADLHKNVDSEHYTHVEKMMTFEIERDKESKKELFGSRTLLRLHRALDFTKQFLKELVEMKDEDKVSTMAGNVYGRTMANYHPWLIRKAAGLALYSLPSRKDLIKKIAPDGIEDAVLKEKVEICVENIDIVYNEIEQLYSKHLLHKLP